MLWERKVSESSAPAVRSTQLLHYPKPPGKSSPTGEEVDQLSWPSACEHWLPICRREIIWTLCHQQDWVFTLTVNSLPCMTCQVREKLVYRNHTAPDAQLATFLGFCLRTECHLMEGGSAGGRVGLLG